MVKKRRRHMAAYKFRVALEALEGSKTISQLSSEHEIHANLIRAWKRQLLEGGPSVFASNGERKQRDQEAQEAELYEQIGRLKMELEWLKKKVTRFDSVRDDVWSILTDSDSQCTATGRTARSQPLLLLLSSGARVNAESASDAPD